LGGFFGVFCGGGSKARRDEGRVGLLGRGSVPSSPPARDLGEGCKLPQWGQGQTTAETDLDYVFSPVEAIS